MGKMKRAPQITGLANIHRPSDSQIATKRLIMSNRIIRMISVFGRSKMSHSLILKAANMYKPNDQARIPTSNRDS